jgi:hypothetical protein
MSAQRLNAKIMATLPVSSPLPRFKRSRYDRRRHRAAAELAALTGRGRG